MKPARSTQPETTQTIAPVIPIRTRKKKERNKHARDTGKTRGQSKHPHVILRDPKKRGRKWWVAIVRDDPSDPRPEYEVTLTRMTQAQALDWAKVASRRIQFEILGEVADKKSRLQLLLWSEDPKIVSALGRYLNWFVARVNGRGQPRSHKTFERYKHDCLDFIGFCATREVVMCHEVTLPLIADWRDSRFSRPSLAHSQKRRSPGTINLERQSIRLFCKRMIRDGYMPQLRVDEVYGALELETEADPKKRFLFPDEYETTLGAYHSYDKASSRYLAGIALLAAKSGLRREEVSLVQVKDIELGGKWGAVIHLPADKAKYGKARDIQAAPFSPFMSELLRELVRNRGPEEYISDLDYDAIGNTIRLIRSHGAPKDFHFHVLRRTSICYAGPMMVNETARKEQFGNEADVAAKHYQSAKGKLPMKAKSIDAVVQKTNPNAVKLERLILKRLAAAADARLPQTRVKIRLPQRIKPK